MPKPHITRTFAPIHFEDLDPHRFEDLVRELVYDLKNWQSLEATGRGGADDGFDIRAYERRFEVVEEDEEEEFVQPKEGNLWMIQCKREQQLGPTKIEAIIKATVTKDNPPYGYILVASANFSKKAYDVFRNTLQTLGVMEFFLWGKAELEDFLHMPKYDRILFTFFGISLATRRRSVATEIRSRVNTKNKLYRIFDNKQSNINQPVLIRAANADNYPFEDKYPQFKVHPLWVPGYVQQFNPDGIWVQVHKHFAVVDSERKEWDYTDQTELLHFQTHGLPKRGKDNIELELNHNIEDFWQYLPSKTQAKLSVWALLRFEDIVMVDDKGDVVYQFPHLYVDFDPAKGPFTRTLNFLEKNGEELEVVNEKYQRVKTFPGKFHVKRKWKLVDNKKLRLNDNLLRELKGGYVEVHKLYDKDSQYSYLEPGDVIAIDLGDSVHEGRYIRITYKYTVDLSHMEKGQPKQYMKYVVEQQSGQPVNDDDIITVFEFRTVYKWQLEERQ